MHCAATRGMGTKWQELSLVEVLYVQCEATKSVSTKFTSSPL